jgi:opacity protein-like surface antigen
MRGYRYHFVFIISKEAVFMGRRMTRRLSILSLSLSLVTLTSTSAKAEMYVAGQIGAHLPSNYSNVQWSVGGVSVRGNDLSLQNSLMYGAKMGYYFDSVKLEGFNLGVETEVFNATPHVQQQNWRVGTTNLGTLPGVNNRVLVWSPFTVVVRYQAGEFEPYAGVGLGVFFSHLSSGNFSSSSTDVGLNTQLGLRYRVTKDVSVFGEWKFNHASVSHTNLVGTGLNVSADYNAHILAFGVGYHF